MVAVDRKFELLGDIAPRVSVPQAQHRFRSFVRKARIGLLALAIQVAILLVLRPQSIRTELGPTTDDSYPEAVFDWSTVEPKRDIEWTSCYSGQKCARLLLPLDYDTPDGPATTIAIRMIPATDLENYRGTILVNPGGPGGSGTSLVERAGKLLAGVVGPSFDVLGFDPRGIGMSVPFADCMSDSQRSIWMTQEGHQVLNASDNTVGLFHARAKMVARRCEEKIGGEWDIGRFVSTANVARDMLEISQKLGQDQIHYWGFSYGSVLGQYFAAMYPDKVKRLIIDGVYDAHNYREALWSSNIVDIDNVVESLFTFCHRAGPEKCALYEPSPEQIRERFFRILGDVEKNPVALPLAEPPVVITRKALVSQLFQAAYSPLRLFDAVINTAHAVETANTTALYTLLPSIMEPTQCKCEERDRSYHVDTEVTFAIACGDANQRSWDLEGYQEYYKGLEDMSHLMAPMWAYFWIQCAEWRIRPKWRWTGPLEAQNTSHPILVVSPKHDPVTPYSDAVIVRKRYGGAGLLVQNSYGHCSTSAPSLCTAKHIRRYLEEGTIPDEGTECEVDELPLVGKAESVSVGVLDADDAELLETLHNLSASMPVYGVL